MRESGGRGPSSRLAVYYRCADVRARIAEYCGGSSKEPASFSAWQIAGYGGARRLMEPEGAPVARACGQFGALLKEGADVCRSLADTEGTLIHLDLDYANPDDPSEALRHPARVFARMEPVHREALARLRGYGLCPLTLMTARGYHLVVRARRGSALHTALADMGTLSDSLRARYEGLEAVFSDAVLMGRAHEGAGRLVEHLAHEILRALGGQTPLPVALADLRPPGGGPFACIDISAYGDPLFGRHLRCAFSSNQKAWMTGLTPRRPFAISLPRRGAFSPLLRIREDPAASARMAAGESTVIPDAPPASMAWVGDYRASRLSAFHRAFDQGPQMKPQDWPFSYDTLDVRAFPDCVRLALEFPNPALLAPVFLRTVALALWGLGWHPRSVAGLIRSRFEAEHGWGDYWRRYDSASRAEFYTRLLCGAVADGIDLPGDFTCESQALRGACTQTRCGYELKRLFPGARAGDPPAKAPRAERRPP